MKKNKKWTIPLQCLLLYLCVCIALAVMRYTQDYGADCGFEAVLFTLLSGIDGVDPALVKRFIIYSPVIGLPITAALAFLIWWPIRFSLCLQLKKSGREITLFPVPKSSLTPIITVLSLSLLVFSVWRVGLMQWAVNQTRRSDLLDSRYVYPEEERIHFPEKKRNLVYLYLESMETTMLSMEEGGAMEVSRIPELADLAQNNISFSNTEQLGGWGIYTGSTWTTGAIVSQISGVPLLTPFQENEKSVTKQILPGLTTLWDILHSQGYRQEFLMGSQSSFSELDKLMTQHGIDTVFDSDCAAEEGIITPEYESAWGMTDELLFDCARRDITDLAQQGEPFAIYVNTIDTHAEEGMRCRLCGDEFGENYENVYACSSRQVAEFLEWLQAQPFYEDTAVIVCGDHLSMAGGYFSRAGLEHFDRRVYNCFINPAVLPGQTQNREITPFDMFPSTLAAMGCSIDEDRLGLGVNLFSNQPTLAEQLTPEGLESELSRSTRSFVSLFCTVPQ